MADYFYASYHFDVPLSPGPELAETKTMHPWRARLAFCCTLWPDIRQCIQKRFLKASASVFGNRGIVSKVKVKQNGIYGLDGMYYFWTRGCWIQAILTTN